MSGIRFLIIFTLLSAGLLPQRLWASPADECIRAIRVVSQESGISEKVMLAVSLTETGRTLDGRYAPWPWVLNQGGESFWFDSRAKAISKLEALLKAGVRNVDVGCFQLNWHWHGQQFASLEAMIDPLTNARYASRFLKELYAKSGDWQQAVSAYHSATPALATKYYDRFNRIYSSLDGAADLFEAAFDTVPQSHMSRVIRANNYPLLQSGEVLSTGSLFAASRVIRPLIGGQ